MMTPEELATIRERAGSLPYVRGTRITTACDDIVDLLAEVDRLRGELQQVQAREGTCRRALIRCQVVLDSLECGCDSYNGFVCTLHADREMVKQVLATVEGGAE